MTPKERASLLNGFATVRETRIKSLLDAVLATDWGMANKLTKAILHDQAVREELLIRLERDPDFTWDQAMTVIRGCRRPDEAFVVGATMWERLLQEDE